METSMGDVENEQPRDDFEVEITDLDEPGQTGAGSKAVPSSKLLHLALKPQFLLHHRKLQLLITTSVVVMAILIIVGSVMGVRNLVPGGSASALPTPATSSGPHN